MRLSALAENLGGRLLGDGDIEVFAVKTLEEAGERDLSFLTNHKYAEKAMKTGAACILTDEKFAAHNAHELPCACIALENPYLAFAQSLLLLHPPKSYPSGVSEHAVVHPEAEVGEGVSVLPGAVVGRARLGRETRIMPQAYIDDDVQIGAECIIGPGCVLMAGTRLGDRVILNPGVILGGDGFGFAPVGQQNVKVPQVGGIQVGDDVEMGANTCVDRGAVSDTRVGRGTKIDNLVQLAHGVQVGEDAVIIAQVGVAGSTKVGNRAVLAGQVGVVGHIEIGDDARVAAQAGVHRSVPEKAAMSGSPAIPHKLYLRGASHYRRFDEYVKRIKEAEKKIASLEARLAELTPAKELEGES
jgi:UDP-3-O-[3-hydroxymyristoyl] glucosamine N-acyltransferase